LAQRRKRPATWLDGLILAAYLAMGLGAAVLNDLVTTRDRGIYAVSPRPAWRGLPWWLQALQIPSKRVQGDFVAFLEVMSVGVALALFRRRPWRFPVLPAPGLAATAAVAAVILLNRAWFFLRIREGGVWHGYVLVGAWVYYQAEFLPGAESVSVAASIMGVWGYLALAGAWEVRDDWRDWLGRWVGWSWISAAGLRALCFTLWG
jgi:hypothetical protein